MDHISLPVADVGSSQHLKLCAGQNAITTHSRRNGRITTVFIRITFVQLQSDQYRLIGYRQFCGFIRPDRGIQLDFLKDIPGSCAFFFDQILALSQRFRNSNAVLIRGHGGCQTAAVFVIVANLKNNTLDGIPVYAVGLGDLNPALGGFILNRNFVGLKIIGSDCHLCRELVINKMLGYKGFFNLVSAIGQQG